MADVGIVLLNRESQFLAGEELAFGDDPMISLPIIGNEGLAFQPADFVDELPTGLIITPTQHPGHGSPSNKVIGPPQPEFSVFF